jgi:hypothetical protein
MRHRFDFDISANIPDKPCAPIFIVRLAECNLEAEYLNRTSVTKFACRSLAGRQLEEETTEIPEWEGKTHHFASRGDVSGLFFKVPNSNLDRVYYTD